VQLTLLALALDGVIMTIVGIGALIFFHELGHFLACRLTGTRVEAFSVGFGKEIFGWTRGNTRYRVGIIPLGGYVKMAAENPGEKNTGAPDEFPNKSFGARLFIMANGVVFNFILAFVLFAIAFSVGVPFFRAEVGRTQPGGPAWEAGLLPGDLVTRVDGGRIIDFGDLSQEVALSDGSLELTVKRGDETFDVTVTPRYDESLGIPAIGIAPAVDRHAAGVVEDSPIANAGGRKGDVILSIDGTPTPAPADVVSVLEASAGRAPEGAKEFSARVEVRRADGTVDLLEPTLPLADRAQLGIRPYQGTRVTAVKNDLGEVVPRGAQLVAVNGRPVADLALWLQRAGDDPVREVTIRRDDQETTRGVERTVTERGLADALAGDSDMESTRIAVRPSMSAERAGLRTGDAVRKIGDKAVSTWNELVEAIRAHGTGPIEIEVERDGETRTFTFVPGRWPKSGALGYEFEQVRNVHRVDDLGEALATGWQRTIVFGRSVLLTIRSLVTARVSARQVGGPIMIATAAYTMFAEGWGRYLYLLAIISVNLAILNLLPIPVLDGGQIVLLCAEKLRGKPLPERVVGYYQLVGLVLIMGLLILALSNDVRNFILPS